MKTTLKSILMMFLLVFVPCTSFADDVPIESVEIVDLPDVLKVGETYSFHLKIYPENATINYLTAQSSNTHILEIREETYAPGFNEELEAKCLSYGKCTINIVDPNSDTVLGSKDVMVVSSSPLKPSVSNPIDLDFTSQNVDVSQIDWTDASAVTAFMKSNVPGIKDNFSFKMYRSNTDLKGYTHYDCKQIDNTYGNDAYGCELIAHVGKDNKLIYITGTLADELSEEEVTEKKLIYSERTPSYNIDASKYTQKADLSGDLYYYKKDHITADKGFAGSTDGEGTYALEDPGHVYTLNYTASNLLYGLEGLSLESMLEQYPTFTSTSPTFSEGYNGMESVISNLQGYINPELTTDKSAKLEIRKCNIKEIDGMDWDLPWNNGTTVLTKTIEIGEYGAISVNLEDFKLSMPNRQVDPDASVEKDFYIAHITDSKDVLLLYVPMSIQHINEDFGYVSATRKLTQCQPALDVHWGLERAMEVYKNTFDLDGYDNHGSPVVALVNYPNVNNASYEGMLDDGCALMTFGMGDVNIGDVSYPCAEIGTLGHEYTHAVARKLMAGNPETGALNESYADIMGKMIERKVLDNDYAYQSLGESVKYVDWKINMLSSGGSPIKYIRRFDDPSKDWNNDPNYYNGARWNEVSREVHQDAGVQNYWFYLLCTGAKDFQPEEGEKVSITAIPRDSAELIAFGAMMYFSNTVTTYPMARKHSIRAAELYFGKDSQEVKSVYSAWYAVGVGTDEWQPGMSTSLDAISEDSSVGADNVRKVYVNGRICIQKGGKTYDILGRKM